MYSYTLLLVACFCFDGCFYSTHPACRMAGWTWNEEILVLRHIIMRHQKGKAHRQTDRQTKLTTGGSTLSQQTKPNQQFDQEAIEKDCQWKSLKSALLKDKIKNVAEMSKALRKDAQSSSFVCEWVLFEAAHPCREQQFSRNRNCRTKQRRSLVVRSLSTRQTKCNNYAGKWRVVNCCHAVAVATSLQKDTNQRLWLASSKPCNDDTQHRDCDYCLFLLFVWLPACLPDCGNWRLKYGFDSNCSRML